MKHSAEEAWNKPKNYTGNDFCWRHCEIQSAQMTKPRAPAHFVHSSASIEKGQWSTSECSCEAGSCKDAQVCRCTSNLGNSCMDAWLWPPPKTHRESGSKNWGVDGLHDVSSPFFKILSRLLNGQGYVSISCQLLLCVQHVQTWNKNLQRSSAYLDFFALHLLLSFVSSQSFLDDMRKKNTSPVLRATKHAFHSKFMTYNYVLHRFSSHWTSLNSSHSFPRHKDHPPSKTRVSCSLGLNIKHVWNRQPVIQRIVS